MEKGIIYEPLYSVGKIVKSEGGKFITCAFCEEEIKTSRQEIVVYQENNDSFYHVACYQDWQKILTGEIFIKSCS
jgi:hypothetical protein